MRGRLLIYGATGYTGRLIAAEAKRLGCDVVLAGRNAERLERLGASLRLPWYAVGLDEAGELDRALADVDVVLHAAGPFSVTARWMLEACLRTCTHYLDIAGELAVFQLARQYDGVSRRRGIMIMPGVGFGIVASDCLAAHVAARVPNARWLRIALSYPPIVSRGSMRTMFSLVHSHVAVRRGGRLVSVPVGRLERAFDYGEGDQWSTALSWPDVYTAYYTTGIKNIEVYVEAGVLTRSLYQLGALLAEPLSLPLVQALFRFSTNVWPEGPSMRTNLSAEQVIVAEIEDQWRRRARVRLKTANGYEFTPFSAMAIAQRVLAGDFCIGFQTPAKIFGADFILAVPGTSRHDA